VRQLRLTINAQPAVTRLTPTTGPRPTAFGFAGRHLFPKTPSNRPVNVHRNPPLVQCTTSKGQIAC
jgi:hypothetical protein